MIFIGVTWSLAAMTETGIEVERDYDLQRKDETRKWEVYGHKHCGNEETQK